MKFVKGMLVGTLISAGVMYMMSENEGSKKENDKKKENNLQKNGNVIITFPFLNIRLKN